MVMNGKPVALPEETRARVKKAAEELHYYTDFNARAMVMGKTNIIGVIVPDISTPAKQRLLSSFFSPSYPFALFLLYPRSFFHSRFCVTESRNLSLAVFGCFHKLLFITMKSVRRILPVAPIF